jgi:hypothetical protein
MTARQPLAVVTLRSFFADKHVSLFVNDYVLKIIHL